MVKEMKSIGLEPCTPVLSYKSKAERLGNIAAHEPMEVRISLPSHMTKAPLMTPKIRYVMVVSLEAGPSQQNATTEEEGMDLWQSSFYPVYEEPFFPLPEMSVEVVLQLCEDMPPKDLVKLFLATCVVALNTEIKIRLLQFKVCFYHLFAMLGEWAYYIQWIQPKEIARTIPNREDRISRAYLH